MNAKDKEQVVQKNVFVHGDRHLLLKKSAVVVIKDGNNGRSPVISWVLHNNYVSKNRITLRWRVRHDEGEFTGCSRCKEFLPNLEDGVFPGVVVLVKSEKPLRKQ